MLFITKFAYANQSSFCKCYCRKLKSLKTTALQWFVNAKDCGNILAKDCKLQLFFYQFVVIYLDYTISLFCSPLL